LLSYLFFLSDLFLTLDKTIVKDYIGYSKLI
jgi:hypothetical protein